MYYDTFMCSEVDTASKVIITDNKVIFHPVSPDSPQSDDVLDKLTTPKAVERYLTKECGMWILPQRKMEIPAVNHRSLQKLGEPNFFSKPVHELVNYLKARTIVDFRHMNHEQRREWREEIEKRPACQEPFKKVYDNNQIKLNFISGHVQGQLSLLLRNLRNSRQEDLVSAVEPIYLDIADRLGVIGHGASNALYHQMSPIERIRTVKYINKQIMIVLERLLGPTENKQIVEVTDISDDILDILEHQAGAPVTPSARSAPSTA